MTDSLAISINLNSETIHGGLVSAAGEIQGLHSIITPINDGTEAILETIVVLCQRLVERANTTPLIGVGVSTVGLVHHTNGTILHADSSLPMLQDVPLAEILHNQLGLPVRVENDVNAMAVAESQLGAGRARSSFFYIFADSVLNGALVQNGHLWYGTHSSAGQIEHLVAGWMGQRPTSVSQRASGAGIAAEYNMRSRKFRVPNLMEIIQYAGHGDQLAIRVIRDGAHVLASVLSPVISLIDPECVVVGGALVNIGELWWKSFQETLRDSPLPVLSQVELLPAEINEHAAMIGAAMLAHESAKP